MTKLFLIAAIINLPLSIAATEVTLGNVKAVKISQKVSVSECQNNFKQLEGSSFCKVQAWEPRDTDLFLAQSESLRIKVEEGNGKHIEARLHANVNGYYLFVFERKNEYGLSKSITLAEATPLMESLTSQLNNGEVFWKFYRVQEN